MQSVETPRSVPSILKLANEHGWKATSRQIGDDRDGFWGVGLERDDTKLSAIWKDGKLETAWLVLDEPLNPINLKTLKEIVQEPAPIEWGWRSLEERLQQLNVEMPDDLRQNLRDEYEMCGAYISGHPLDLVDTRLFPDAVDTAVVREVDLRTGHYVYPEGEKLDFLGIVEELEHKQTRRGNQPFVVFMLTDETGGVNCVAFGKDYSEMSNGMLVHLTGVISERQERREIRATTIRELTW